MDPWSQHYNSKDHHHHRQHLRTRQVRDHHPSFSSTLLDQIYKSIDDSSTTNSNNNNNNNLSPIKTKKHQHQNQNRTSSLNDKLFINRKTDEDFIRSRSHKLTEPIFFKHSSSSSSDSSGFSSSESDSFYKRSKSIPKPIRTTPKPVKQQQEQQQGSLVRTKSKASKIYSDLKKVKQPISPGGRLATFLNSIFTGNTKKPNRINTGATGGGTVSASSTCSSASSFSRSCLSKTPSSSEKSKRSVRFFDEETNRKDRESIKSLEIRVREENRRVIEAAKELLRTYQEKKNKDEVSDDEEEEEDEDDLFELDHLSVIGIDKFREELPVYETTRFNTTRIR